MLVAALAMAAAPMPKPREVLADTFLQACADGSLQSPPGKVVAVATPPENLVRRYSGATHMSVYRLTLSVPAYLVVAEYTPPADGVVRRCAIHSVGWTGTSAWRPVISKLLGPMNQEFGGPPSLATIDLYGQCFAVTFADSAAGGIVEGVTFTSDMARKLQIAKYGLQWTREMDKAVEKNNVPHGCPAPAVTKPF